MMCANCSNSAKFEVSYPHSPIVVYCATCLPKHLSVGTFPGTKALETESEAPKKKRKAADDNQEL